LVRLSFEVQERIEGMVEIVRAVGFVTENVK
jgi:hypothetical protein